MAASGFMLYQETPNSLKLKPEKAYAHQVGKKM